MKAKSRKEIVKAEKVEGLIIAGLFILFLRVLDAS